MTPEQTKELAKRIVEDHGIIGSTWPMHQELAASYLTLLEENAQLSERLKSLEDAMRSLASYYGAGGYNADTVDPAIFERKIRDGVDDIIRVECDRARGPQISDDEEKHLLRRTIAKQAAELTALRKLVEAAKRIEWNHSRYMPSDVWNELQAALAALTPTPEAQTSDDDGCERCPHGVGYESYDGCDLCDAIQTPEAPMSESKKDGCCGCGGPLSKNGGCPVCMSESKPEPVITGVGFYRTRDGRKAEVQFTETRPGHYFASGRIGERCFLTWMRNGRAAILEESPIDLIATWIEPAKEEKPQELPAPRFKVGDMVRVARFASPRGGEIGTLTAVAIHYLHPGWQVRFADGFELSYATTALEPLPPEPSPGPSTHPDHALKDERDFADALCRERDSLRERLKEAERMLRMIASNEKYWGNSAAVKDFLAGVPPLSQQPSTPPTLTVEERKTLEEVATMMPADYDCDLCDAVGILARELLAR